MVLSILFRLLFNSYTKSTSGPEDYLSILFRLLFNQTRCPNCDGYVNFQSYLGYYLTSGEGQKIVVMKIFQSYLGYYLTFFSHGSGHWQGSFQSYLGYYLTRDSGGYVVTLQGFQSYLGYYLTIKSIVKCIGFCTFNPI